MNALHVEKQAEVEQPDFAGLIRWLYRQAQQADEDSRARAALAELRRGLRDDPRDRLVVIKYMVPFLGPEPRTDWQRWQEECCGLVAALFASHPAAKYGVSLGRALGDIPEKSGSMEGRFLQLLAVRPERPDDPERLRVPLRQAVRLLAANNVSLDWQRLLTDLGQWNHDEMRVQQRWARDFYKSASDPALDPALDPNEPPNGEKPDEN